MLKTFLLFSSVIWSILGILCFDPAFLAANVGILGNTPAATVELRAMYGGLPLAVGLLSALAVVRPYFVVPALLMLGFLCAGLFSARLLGAVLVAELSSYTLLALLYESVSAAIAFWLWRRDPARAP